MSGPSLATFNPSIVQSFLQGWAAAGGGNISLTAHAYPLGPASTPAASCTAANFLNVSRVTAMGTWLSNWVSAVAAYGSPSETRLVLEETGSNSMGGCPGFSDRFISGFYWMHTMGLVADAGFQQVNRQDLTGWAVGQPTGSNNNLFGPPDWVEGNQTDNEDNLSSNGSPHADYFTTLLWQRLMGTGVLSSAVAPSQAASGSSLAVHAWCAAPSASDKAGAITVRCRHPVCMRMIACLHAAFPCPVRGGTWPSHAPVQQVAYVNAGPIAVPLKLQSTGGSVIPMAPRTEYVLTSASSSVSTASGNGTNLTTIALYLNGNGPIGVHGDGSLNSPFSSAARSSRPMGVEVTYGKNGPILLPPYSYGFHVLHSAGVSICGGGDGAAPTSASDSGGSGGISRHDEILSAVMLVVVIFFCYVGYENMKDKEKVRDEKRAAEKTAETSLLEKNKSTGGYGAALPSGSTSPYPGAPPGRGSMPGPYPGALGGGYMPGPYPGALGGGYMPGGGVSFSGAAFPSAAGSSFLPPRVHQS